MDYGVLSSYFDGAVAKKLVAVDIDRKRSNQHEFNGTAELRSVTHNFFRKLTTA